MAIFKTLFGDGNWQKAGVEAGIELNLRELGLAPAIIKYRAVQGAIRKAVELVWEEDPTFYPNASKETRARLEFGIAAQIVEEMGHAVNGRGRFAS
jgi:hypothetical protein